MNTLIARSALLTGIASGAVMVGLSDLLKPSDPCATPSVQAGWRKYGRAPVLGGVLGTCFDVCLLHEQGRYRMWFSWRPTGSIALTESHDGIHWGAVHIALGSRPASGWEQMVNRPIVLRRGGLYHMWYTGQSQTVSAIGHAISRDGRIWTRTGARPVLAPWAPWELDAVMCPHVVWDQRTAMYRLWYSGGHAFEPDAIGYATSRDGRLWHRYGHEPIFRPDPRSPWEQSRVTACQVVRDGPWHLMFYVGFCTQARAHIGLARSRDGITNWQRHPLNPIIGPGSGHAWDGDAVYKPFALRSGRSWNLWYNGRRASIEQIGLALHEGDALWL